MLKLKNFNRFDCIKGLIIVILLVLGVKYFKYLNPKSISQFIQQSGAFAPLIFILICSLRPLLFFVPSLGLTMVAGVLFGSVWGTVYVSIGGIFSTAIGYYFARLLGRKTVDKIINSNDKIIYIDNFAKQYSKRVVLCLRLFNLPWDLVSYWAGLSNIAFKDFYISSMIVLVPISFLYTYLGSNIFTPNSWGFIISLGIIFLLGAAPFIAHKIKKNK